MSRIGNWELDIRSGAFLGSAEAFRLFDFGDNAGVRPLSDLDLALNFSGFDVPEKRAF